MFKKVRSVLQRRQRQCVPPQYRYPLLTDSQIIQAVDVARTYETRFGYDCIDNYYGLCIRFNNRETLDNTKYRILDYDAITKIVMIDLDACSPQFWMQLQNKSETKSYSVKVSLSVGNYYLYKIGPNENIVGSDIGYSLPGFKNMYKINLDDDSLLLTVAEQISKQLKHAAVSKQKIIISMARCPKKGEPVFRDFIHVYFYLYRGGGG